MYLYKLESFDPLFNFNPVNHITVREHGKIRGRLIKFINVLNRNDDRVIGTGNVVEL